MVLLLGGTANRQVYGHRKQKGGFQGQREERNGELLLNVYRISFWGDEKVPEMDSGVGGTVNILHTEGYA